MKVTDLMIGDWVDVYHELPDESGFYKPLQVTGIHQNDGVCFGYDVVESPWIDPEEFEAVKPIRLTPEILEKNGCKRYDEATRRDGLYKYEIGSRCIVVFDLNPVRTPFIECENATCRMQRKIIYVHELQHALRLCGIDKEIEL